MKQCRNYIWTVTVLLKEGERDLVVKLVRSHDALHQLPVGGSRAPDSTAISHDFLPFPPSTEFGIISHFPSRLAEHPHGGIKGPKQAIIIIKIKEQSAP